MPTLTLMLKGAIVERFTLKAGHDCTIGRNSLNDIVIDQPAVSGFHVKIESVARTFVLRDLNSTNGTFINQKRVKQQNLQHQDIILIGNHELLFDKSDLQVESTPEPELGADDKTRILDTRAYDVYRKVLQENSPKKVKISFRERIHQYLSRLKDMFS